MREGLIDELGSLSDAIAALYTMIDENRAKAKTDADASNA